MTVLLAMAAARHAATGHVRLHGHARPQPSRASAPRRPRRRDGHGRASGRAGRASWPPPGRARLVAPRRHARSRGPLLRAAPGLPMPATTRGHDHPQGLRHARRRVRPRLQRTAPCSWRRPARAPTRRRCSARRRARAKQPGVAAVAPFPAGRAPRSRSSRFSRPRPRRTPRRPRSSRTSARTSSRRSSTVRPCASTSAAAPPSSTTSPPSSAASCRCSSPSSSASGSCSFSSPSAAWSYRPPRRA